MIHIMFSGNKEKFLEWANNVLGVGSEYAAQCVAVLVNQYGVNAENIDASSLKEHCTGYLIGCVTRQNPPMTPKDFIEERLAELSDYGLSKLGLTRSDYDKHS